jgi:hypothetical protein
MTAVAIPPFAFAEADRKSHSGLRGFARRLKLEAMVSRPGSCLDKDGEQEAAFHCGGK